MSSIFKNCSSLLSLPDISKWNTDAYISGMFDNCSSLSSLSDISKWKKLKEHILYWHSRKSDSFYDFDNKININY